MLRSESMRSFVCACLVLLPACTDSAKDEPGGGTSLGPEAGTSPDAHAEAAARETPSGRYVALGSSFAAGPGIPDTVPDQACGRSTNNYAHLVAADLGLELVDVSCAGATTENVALAPQGTNPLQIDAVTAETRIVTVTMGGNDVAYTGVLSTCGSDGAGGRSCLAGTDGGAADVDPTVIDGYFAALGDGLVTMLDAVKQAAPSARIYLVGYPRLLADPPAPCPPDVPMLPDDATYAGSVGARLQTAFEAAASASGVHFVDVYTASEGHDACAPADQRWVQGQAGPGPISYHPVAAGMRAQADLIVEQIKRTF